MNDEFQTYWRTNFPDCPPVSYLFKSKLNHLWFRIHTLPESKRYAENIEETQEILLRQKTIFSDIVGENEDCFLVCLGYNQNPTKIYKNQFPILAKLLTHESEPILLPEIEEDREKGEIFQLAFGKQRIKFDDLKEILIAVADWKIAHFFILNPNLKRIFDPYDGGVDMILETSAKRDEFKGKYKDRSSSHPKGY
jgi:hypothetical protein